MDTFLFYIKNFAIPILLILILFVCLVLLTKRFLTQWQLKRTKKYRTVVQQFLIEIVLYKYDKQELKTKLRHFQNSIPFNRKWCKLLVINEMIRLKKTIKGDQTMIISLLYKSLKLHVFSANLIKNWVPYKKCIGFYHFQMMRYIKGKDQIIPYLTNSNDLIRSNANISYLALIDLSKEELAHFPDHISKLDQIKIMDIFFTFWYRPIEAL